MLLGELQYYPTHAIEETSYDEASPLTTYDHASIADVFFLLY